jgi:hypothetical protein
VLYNRACEPLLLIKCVFTRTIDIAKGENQLELGISTNNRDQREGKLASVHDEDSIGL